MIPTPFTDKPSNLAPLPSATERAVSAIMSDLSSHDQRQHHDAAIKIACRHCDALPNHRCLERSPAKHYVDFHPERVADAPTASTTPERKIPMTTTTTPAPVEPAKLSANAVKAIVAEAVIHAAAARLSDAKWKHPQITPADAREIAAQFLTYLPGAAWDDSLPAPILLSSGARRSIAVAR